MKPFPVVALFAAVALLVSGRCFADSSLGSWQYQDSTLGSAHASLSSDGTDLTFSVSSNGGSGTLIGPLANIKGINLCESPFVSVGVDGKTRSFTATTTGHNSPFGPGYTNGATGWGFAMNFDDDQISVARRVAQALSSATGITVVTQTADQCMGM